MLFFILEKQFSENYVIKEDNPIVDSSRKVVGSIWSS
jgi:hypothetical protein